MNTWWSLSLRKIFLESRLFTCRVLWPLRNSHGVSHGHCMKLKTRRNPQNMKYMTYCNTAKGGPSQGHTQHARKNMWSSAVWFLGYVSGHTDKQTDRHTHYNTSHLSRSNSLRACWKTQYANILTDHCGRNVVKSVCLIRSRALRTEAAAVAVGPTMGY